MAKWTVEQDVKELREEVMKVHNEAAADPVTAPAAFGVACTILKNGLHCNLTTAALLLDCWLTECKLKAEKPPIPP